MNTYMYEIQTPSGGVRGYLANGKIKTYATDTEYKLVKDHIANLEAILSHINRKNMTVKIEALGEDLWQVIKQWQYIPKKIYEPIANALRAEAIDV